MDNQALGYDKIIRGYELYVLNGSQYFLSKNDIKVKLISDQYVKINFVKSEKFNSVPWSLYLAGHGDIGFVEEHVNSGSSPLAHHLQYGYGIGVHLITYYDRVLIFEYSINKMNEKGFFISTKFPI